MKIFFCLLLVGLVAVCGGGCHRQTSPPAPLPAQQVPTEFNKAFKTSNPDVQRVAELVSAGVQNQDYSTAYEAVQSLGAAPGLTADQRLLSVRALLAITKELQDAAARGDQRATALLRQRQATR